MNEKNFIKINVKSKLKQNDKKLIISYFWLLLLTALNAACIK